ncbi:hypothetical protein LCGC14_1616040 [marine sediment metagenome]|uniref:Uncharacterized protein n=2 Tax=root TaxID=1 RepID=A0A9C9NHW2_9HYPH|nr:hypothetical protein [Aurantimonas coralicida]
MRRRTRRHLTRVEPFTWNRGRVQEPAPRPDDAARGCIILTDAPTRVEPTGDVAFADEIRTLDLDRDIAPYRPSK